MTAAREEPPYKRTNTDGRLNLGSYEVTQALDIVQAAHAAYVTEIEANDPHRTDPPTHLEVSTLAAWLAAAVDAVQQQTTGLRLDRMAASHRNAWRCVRQALTVHPVPFGADHDTRTSWWQALTAHAVELYRTALELVDSDGGRRP